VSKGACTYIHLPFYLKGFVLKEKKAKEKQKKYVQENVRQVKKKTEF
jgi:hypothetical protein